MISAQKFVQEYFSIGKQDLDSRQHLLDFFSSCGSPFTFFCFSVVYDVQFFFFRLCYPPLKKITVSRSVNNVDVYYNDVDK